jgi:hypothetical protein
MKPFVFKQNALAYQKCLFHSDTFLLFYLPVCSVIRTLDLRFLSRVFYHCATRETNLIKFVPEVYHFLFF